MLSVFSSSAVSEHLYPVEFDHGAGANRSQRTNELLRQLDGADAETADRLRQEVVLLNIQVAESIAQRYRNRACR